MKKIDLDHCSVSLGHSWPLLMYGIKVGPRKAAHNKYLFIGLSHLPRERKRGVGVNY